MNKFEIIFQIIILEYEIFLALTQSLPLTQTVPKAYPNPMPTHNTYP